jgi:DNA processing protein
VSRPGWRLERGSDGYPASLEDLGGQAPAAIHGLGEREIVTSLDPDATVTIVGSRRATAYGIGVAEELARLLSSAGFTVVSGMAYGIDAAAHRGALAGGGTTVAVLGGGPDHVYPPSQRGIYRRIAEAGAVISEREPGERAERWSFPARNRIMAALASMTVVVEAADPSGSLITADLANELGRAVGAVPGPVTSRASAGTNRLIFEGAAVVRDAQDVLDRLCGVGAPDVRNAGPPLDDVAAGLLDLVEAGCDTLDAVATQATVPAGQVAVGLATLELLGYVRTDAAGRYERTPRARPAPA